METETPHMPLKGYLHSSTRYELICLPTSDTEAEAGSSFFYGRGSKSRSSKHEMNGSGSGSESSKKILEAEAEAIKNSPLPHHWLIDCTFSKV